MIHKGTKVLPTPRLILRPFKPDDGHDMFVNWASDPEVAKHMPRDAYTDEYDAESFCTARAALSDMPQIYDWAIEHRGIGQVIGEVTLTGVDQRLSMGELGYCLSRSFWGQGIMTEAVCAVLDYAFDELGMYRIYALHDSDNPASGRVMEKCGMKYEGTLRGRALSRSGERSDCLLYSVILPDRK